MLIKGSIFEELLNQIHPDENISVEQKNNLTTGSKLPLKFICECGFGKKGEWAKKKIKDRIRVKENRLTKCPKCALIHRELPVAVR